MPSLQFPIFTLISSTVYYVVIYQQENQKYKRGGGIGCRCVGIVGVHVTCSWGVASWEWTWGGVWCHDGHCAGNSRPSSKEGVALRCCECGWEVTGHLGIVADWVEKYMLGPCAPDIVQFIAAILELR